MHTRENDVTKVIEIYGDSVLEGVLREVLVDEMT